MLYRVKSALLVRVGGKAFFSVPIYLPSWAYFIRPSSCQRTPHSGPAARGCFATGGHRRSSPAGAGSAKKSCPARQARREAPCGGHRSLGRFRLSAASSTQARTFPSPACGWTKATAGSPMLTMPRIRKMWWRRGKPSPPSKAPGHRTSKPYLATTSFHLKSESGRLTLTTSVRRSLPKVVIAPELMT